MADHQGSESVEVLGARQSRPGVTSVPVPLASRIRDRVRGLVLELRRL